MGSFSKGSFNDSLTVSNNKVSSARLKRPFANYNDICRHIKKVTGLVWKVGGHTDELANNVLFRRPCSDIVIQGFNRNKNSSFIMKFD